MSLDVVTRLRVARDLAWADLQPAFEHAIVLAQEADAQASQASMEYATHVSAIYPPLVLKLANAAGEIS